MVNGYWLLVIGKMKKTLTGIIATAAVLAAGTGAWLLVERSSSVPPPHRPTGPPDHRSTILTPQVAALLSSEPVSLDGRSAILATVGNKLPAADRMALLGSITNTPPNGLTAADWHSLANDILQVLRNQRPYTPEYTPRLIGFWHDKSLDPTLRDYALQQLREWVADGDSRTVHEERPEQIALIGRTFLDACTPGHPDCDTGSTTTGTALLALDEWAHSSSPSSGEKTESPHPPIVSPASLEPLLIAHAADPAAHRGLRATALQICARRRIPAALPVSRGILADPASPVILRLSAIAMLSAAGTPEDRLLLADLAKSHASDPLLRAALDKALEGKP